MELKKQMIAIFALIAVVFYISCEVIYVNHKKTWTVSSNGVVNHIEVYMKHESGYLIPLCIEVNEEEQQEELIQRMLGYLSGKQLIEGFVPLFTKNCKMNHIDIVNGVAKIFFNNDFKNYDSNDELKLLQSITWGLTQFQNIRFVQIYMNDEQLVNMPNANTPIPNTLSRSIGINQFESSCNHLSQSESMVIYVSKAVDSRSYILPRTKRIELDENDYEHCVKELLRDISISSGCVSKINEEHLKVNKVKYADGKLCVDVSENILASNRQIKKQVYDCMMLSLYALEGVNAVELSVNGKLIETKKVFSDTLLKYNLVYNQVNYK